MHAAQISPSADGQPSINWLWCSETPSLAQGLRTLNASKSLRGTQMVGVFDRARYSMRAADAPEVPREDWRDAVRWSLKDQLDVPVEDAVLDVLEVPKETHVRQQSTLMAFLVGRADYTAMELAADDLSLRWSALDMPEVALRNLCALAETDDKAHALMVLGELHGMLVITYKGELLMSRTIEVALSSITGADDTRGAALSRASLEVLRTLDSFERMHSQVTLAGMSVVLPPGCDADFIELLTELIYVPLKTFELGQWLKLDALGDDAARVNSSPAFGELCAIGAAMRPSMVGAPDRQTLQLIDTHSAAAHAPTWGAVLGMRLLAGFVAIGAAVGVGLTTTAAAYNRSADQMDTGINTLRTQAVASTVSPIITEVTALRQKEAQQRQMKDTLQSNLAWVSTGYSDFLMALGRQTYPGIWITGLSVQGDGRDLVLSGRTTDPALLPLYLKRLSQEDRFNGRRFAQFEMAEQTTGTGVEDGVTDFTLHGLVQQPSSSKDAGGTK